MTRRDAFDYLVGEIVAGAVRCSCSCSARTMRATLEGLHAPDCAIRRRDRELQAQVGPELAALRALQAELHQRRGPTPQRRPSSSPTARPTNHTPRPYHDLGGM